MYLLNWRGDLNKAYKVVLPDNKDALAIYYSEKADENEGCCSNRV